MGVGWVPLLCLVLVAVGCATARVTEQRVVSGRITDQQGRPVPRTPVLVVGRQLELTTKFDYTQLDRRELKVLTTDDGRYRAEFVPGELGNNLYLFFYAEEGFDGVRFQKPEGVNITKRLKEAGELNFDQVLLDHPRWKEVQQQIARYGADSMKGKVLRQLGLPERIDSGIGDQPAETWWYYSKGISYHFVGPALEGSYTFQPIQGVLPLPATK
ncbi:MAG: carboxypeptidase regulatory-like domain-containing protein [candidate division NC10 bacterium]|nr:carboxypeptidase regulatory-like domain-containing protein [candidate division NC10 bacterium]MDE2321631.1 carboxypeptidase regulatory-like domain-containing protein [candidate division NC10 bacterium]